MAEVDQTALDRQARLPSVEGLQFVDGLFDLTPLDQQTATREHGGIFRSPSVISEKGTDPH